MEEQSKRSSLNIRTQIGAPTTVGAPITSGQPTTSPRADLPHTPIDTTPISRGPSQAVSRNTSQREWAGFPEQRFSFVETPIEDSTQVFDEPPDLEAIAEQRRAEEQTQLGDGEPTRDSAASFGQEKTTPWRMSSAYQQKPPEEQHPALAAPAYNENDPAQQQLDHMTMPPDPQKTPPPQSPSRRNTPANVPTTFAPPPRNPSAPNADSKTPTSNALSNSSTDKAGRQATNDFSVSMCACPGSDISTCFVGFCCPCVLYSKVSFRLTQRSKQGSGTNILGWSSCNGTCTMFAILCGCQGILAAILRRRVRKTYNLEPNDGTADDLIRGCCCCCCSIIQNEREVKFREEELLREAGTRTNPSHMMQGMDSYVPQPATSQQPDARDSMRFAPN